MHYIHHMYLEQIWERETFGHHIVFLQIFDAKVKTLKKLAFINKVNLEKNTRVATPPKPSETSKKKWRTKVKPFLTPHLWYTVWTKLWEPFGILGKMGPFGCAIYYTDPKLLPWFFSYFQHDLIINGLSKMCFTFALQFFLLISGSLDDVLQLRPQISSE
jgi:hypothetical protein